MRAEDLLVQFGRILQIAAEHVRDKAEDRLKYMRHQQPAVVRGDEVAAEAGLKLLVIAVVQLVGAGKELRGIIIAQIEPNVVRLGQGKIATPAPQRGRLPAAGRARPSRPDFFRTVCTKRRSVRLNAA